MAANVIELLLTAKNNASPALKQIQADLQNVDKSVNMLNKIATLDLGLTGMQAALSTIQQVGQVIGETSQAGAQFSRLEGSFQSLAASMGSNGTQILSAIESVTQGTLSQSTIMQQANNAMLLGVADSADEFETLAKIAVDRGRAMGISMEYAFESIVKGVGRLSPLILDNLGIVLDADKTYKDYAESIGKTADALTDAEKRAALISRLKAEVADFDSTQVMDAAGAWERMAASMENATAVAGMWINENTNMVSGLQNLADGLDIVATAFSDDAGVEMRGLIANQNIAKRAVQEYQDMLAALKRDKQSNPLSEIFAGISEAGIQKAIDDWQRKLDDVTSELNKFKVATQSIKDDTSDLGLYKQTAALQALEAEYAKGAVAVDWYAKAMGITKVEAEAQIEAMIRVKGSWEAAAPAIAAAGNAAVAAAQAVAQANALLNSSISSLQSAALQAYSDSGYNSGIIEQFKVQQSVMEGMRTTLEGMDPTEATFLMRQMTDQGTAGFKAVSEYANQSTKAIGGGAGATKQLTKEFSNLQSIVSGLVSSAYQDVGGADISKYLPYSDAPAEDARRIASVMVEGYDSEWAGYFKDKFPLLFSQYMLAGGGDIQKASALLLKDFQDGLRPELLDKGKIKDLAKRALGADKEMNAIIDEIARDLANELQIPIEEAKAAVGGAAGVKKKPMTKEEVEKMFGGIDLAPKWDMTSGKQKFIDAGKKAGVLNENGDLLVPVKVDFTALTNNTLPGDFSIKITTPLVDSMLGKKIEDTLPNIALKFSPNPSTEFYLGLKTNIYDYIGDKEATVSIVPAAYDPVKYDNFLTGVQDMLGTIEVDVSPTAGAINFDLIFDPIRETIKTGLFTQEDADTMVWNLAAAMGIAVWNAPENSFDFVGRSIGSVMKSSFETENYGQSMMDALAKQLDDSKKTLETSAMNSGRAWGTAFLTVVQANVPVELINILTDLVTPRVINQQQATKERGKAE